MSNTATPKPPKPKAPKVAKDKRVSALIRFPKETIERLDILAAGCGKSRNDAVVAAVDAWSGQTPKPKPTTPAREAREVPGSRLDKSTIGRRVGPKKGAKPAPVADDSEEGV